MGLAVFFQDSFLQSTTSTMCYLASVAFYEQTELNDWTPPSITKPSISSKGSPYSHVITPNHSALVFRTTFQIIWYVILLPVIGTLFMVLAQITWCWSWWHMKDVLSFSSQWCRHSGSAMQKAGLQVICRSFKRPPSLMSTVLGLVGVDRNESCKGPAVHICTLPFVVTVSQLSVICSPHKFWVI